MINFQSIFAKKAELLNLIDNYHPIGSETWLSSDISSVEFLPADYTVFRRDRSDGYGGVLLAFSDNLNVTENKITNHHECEIVVCTLTYEHQKIIISSIYRPPSTDISYTQNLCNILEEMVASNPNTPLWIGGDLNLPNIDWTNSSILNNRYPMALCNIVLDFVMNHDFSQLVQTPTRVNNILDIFLSNYPSYVTSCEVIPGISDHDIVSITTSVSMPMSKPTSRSIFLWHKANFSTICNYIDEFTQNFLNTYDHHAFIDILWQEFKSLSKTCLDMIPQAKAPTGSRPP